MPGELAADLGERGVGSTRARVRVCMCDDGMCDSQVGLGLGLVGDSRVRGLRFGKIKVSGVLGSEAFGPRWIRQAWWLVRFYLSLMLVGFGQVLGFSDIGPLLGVGSEGSRPLGVRPGHRLGLAGLFGQKVVQAFRSLG